MKYSVITFITNNYELVREVDYKSPDAEYLLITDNPNLKSATWKVIYEPLLDTDKIDGVTKMYLIKYNVHKYASNDIIVRVDGSMKILSDITPIVDNFIKGNYDIMVMQHPFHNNFGDEYDEWINGRGLDSKYKKIFYEKMRYCGYDYNWQGMFETTVQIYRKSKTLFNFFDDMLSCVLNGNILDGNVDKNDQCYQTCLLMTKYNNTLKTLVVSDQLVCSKYMDMYRHNSYEKEKLRYELFSNFSWQYGKWRGKDMKLEYFK